MMSDSQYFWFGFSFDLIVIHELFVEVNVIICYRLFFFHSLTLVFVMALKNYHYQMSAPFEPLFLPGHKHSPEQLRIYTQQAIKDHDVVVEEYLNHLVDCGEWDLRDFLAEGGVVS